MGAGACAVLVVVGGIVFVRPPASQPGRDAPAVLPVALVPLEHAADPQARTAAVSLRDPVPLYLPTPLNSGQSEALSFDGRREPVAAFRNFTASLFFSEAGLRVDFPAPVPVPAGVVEAVEVVQGSQMVQYFGRRELELPSLQKRLGFLEVTRADDGSTVLMEELPGTAGAPSADWGPVDMVVAVNVSGLIGMPVVIQSSGSAPFDAWLRGYLAGSYRIGQRLQPGIYRISIGP